MWQFNDTFIGINTESTEFQPAGFKLVSGAGIRFEQMKTT